MRILRLTMLALLASCFVVATYLTLRGFNLLGSPSAAEAKSVPAGHQEIAFLLPAASVDGWERLIAALDVLERDWATLHPNLPKLKVSKEQAFVEMTADVPELALWLEGHDASKLWIRWYKLSSENDARKWVEKLAQRRPAPLAILGGDTSDRALVLGRVLHGQRSGWRGADPLFLITTATADHDDPADPSKGDADLPKLIEVYKGRSFRFSFTNTRMAEVVLDFVRTHPELWPMNGGDPGVVAGGVAAGNVWDCFPALHDAVHPTPRTLHPQIWADERYSTDLAKRFQHVFTRMFPLGEIGNTFQIGYGTGDYYHPNPQEVIAVTWLLDQNGQLRDRRQLLLLPTGSDRARRYLRTLVRRAPLHARNVVVISGDSITINSIYRDRDIAWNVLDLPVPLLLFTHRNPVSRAVGFQPGEGGGTTSTTTGTDVLLLNRDILESLMLASFPGDKMDWETDRVRERLRKIRWRKGNVLGVPDAGQAVPVKDVGLPLFDALGNRTDRTGEHVIWLQPVVEGNSPQPKADLTVWRLQQDAKSDNAWQRVERIRATYEFSGAR